MPRGRVPASFLAAAICSGGVTFAQSLAFTREHVPSYPGARGIAAADFDRDGWVDLAQANAGRNTVTILINQRGAARSFLPVYDVPVGAGPFDLVAGDFNRDGIADLAVANADGHSVSVLRGQTAGGFSRNDVVVQPGPRGIAASDINKDGRLDLLVTGWNNNTFQVLIGNGSGGFTAGALVGGLPARPQGLAAADFNRDGHLDVVVASDSSAGLTLLTGNGGTIFAPRAVPGAGSLNVLAAGDLNGDGWTDVAAAASGANRVAVYLGGTSGLTYSRSYPTAVSPRGILLRDLTHDGMLDVAVANRSGHSVSVLVGNRALPGTLLTAEHFPAGTGSRAIVSEDFDRDGLFDLATGNQDAATATLLWNETAFDTAGFSFSRVTFGTPSNSLGGSAALPADFNGDGKLDVVVKPDYRAGQVLHVLITDGATVVLATPRYFGGYLIGDFNRDDHADVLIVDGTHDTLTIWPYLGDGRGAFTRAPATTIAMSHWTIAAGDLNRDAIPDLVFVTYDPAVRSFALQLLRGKGDGTFLPGSRVHTSADYTSGQQIVDVNRDGKTDVAGFVGGTLTVLYGDGAGNLTPGSASVMSNYVLQNLALADLNQDGWLDAVAGEQGQLRIALGNRNGFGTTAVIRLEGYSNWSSVAIADIDLDGRLDIIGGSGFILRGAGDGTFGRQERYDWDSPTLSAVDFTRDGLPDLVMPASNGAFDVVVNSRNGLNRTPTVDAGPDRTFDYSEQFGEGSASLMAIGADPDLHRLTYVWRDENGTVVSTDDGPWVTFERLPGTYSYTVTVFDGRGGTATDTILVTIAPTKEIVLWSASGFYNGTFSEVQDASAAYGERGYDRNLGRPKVTIPSANPENRIMLGFVADPTQTYKLWIRLKADGNHWSNDSVWVQFTGSADANGAPIYRYGTTSGLAVNLEECSGCGISGWGWEDDGWGAVDRSGVTLRFPSGGHQSIVIQTREDGVSIDQVVLSSEKYLTTRPGKSKNDGTILRFTSWQEEG